MNNAEKVEEENSMPRTRQVVEGVVSRIELLLQVNVPRPAAASQSPEHSHMSTKQHPVVSITSTIMFLVQMCFSFLLSCTAFL